MVKNRYRPYGVDYFAVFLVAFTPGTPECLMLLLFLKNAPDCVFVPTCAPIGSDNLRQAVSLSAQWKSLRSFFYDR